MLANRACLGGQTPNVFCLTLVYVFKLGIFILITVLYSDKHRRSFQVSNIGFFPKIYWRPNRFPLWTLMRYTLAKRHAGCCHWVKLVLEWFHVFGLLVAAGFPRRQISALLLCLAIWQLLVQSCDTCIDFSHSSFYVIKDDFLACNFIFFVQYTFWRLDAITLLRPSLVK